LAQGKLPLGALAEAEGIPSLAPVLAKVSPSVVSIRAESRAEAQRSADRARRNSKTATEGRESRAGSGVIFDAAAGLIVTNHHVIAGASQLTVVMLRGRTLPATIVGSDPDTDLAIIKVPADELAAVAFSDSNLLQIGDFVVAVGVPFPLGRTMTSGIVSGLHRSNIGIAQAEDFIQTDAAIYPGDSGGALVNLRGELVGINTGYVGVSGSNSGVGFAIPSNLVRRVLDEILTHGAVHRGTLGIGYSDAAPSLLRALNLTIPRPVIDKVDPGSPAERAGLKKGDLVTAVDGLPVREADSLQRKLGLVWSGEVVSLTVQRGSESLAVPVTMEDPGAAPSKQGAAPVKGRNLLR
jgi:S1-C subfamily serine protease